MARIVILRSRATGGLEPRVERAAKALQDDGHQVTVFLWDREVAYPRAESQEGLQIRRLPLPAPYNRPGLLVPMAWWMLAAFRATRGADVVHAADLDTLPAALAAKALRGAKVIYDIFDFYGDLVARPLSRKTRHRLRRLEAGLAGFADLVLLPDAVRREALGEAFPRPVEIVMNVLPDEVVPEEQHEGFVLFYGGNLGPDRGLLEASEAVRGLEGVTLRIAGTGELEESLRSRAERSTELEFFGQIDHPRLLRETSRAHAVLAWYDPAIPANRLASPNKLFEAMMLRRPILVSSGTHMAELVSAEGVGLEISYGDGKALREAVRRLKDDPSYAESLGRRGREAYEREYNWGTNEKKLREAYRRVFS